MLKAIQAKLGSLVQETWAGEMVAWGERVALYRDYYDGDHRAKMTKEMREMLRIADEKTEHFNDNYCEMVVNTMADRLKVTAVEGGSPEANQWSAMVLDDNRFDGLQMDVHEACIRDGDTFVMVTADPATNALVMAHEPAWDNDTGMLVVYDRTRQHIKAAVKVWYEGDARLVNLYWPDKVERFVWTDGETVEGQTISGKLGGREDEQGTDVPWLPNHVPVVHFRNRSQSRKTSGISEEASIIPLQDALNRTLVSMIMTGELTAFGIPIAKGFMPPDKLAPGSWIYFGESADPAKLAAMEASRMQQGELVPFINQAEFLIDQMGTISRTPLPGFMGGDAASGEALKQREVGLLGKIGKFQVKVGNSWEDVLALAWLVQQTFGKEKPPPVERWQCRWKDAQTRNDTEVIQNALAVADQVGEMETLRLIAPVYGWDEQKIKDILREKREQAAANLSMIGLPGFDRLRNAGAADNADEEDQGEETADAAA